MDFLQSLLEKGLKLCPLNTVYKDGEQEQTDAQTNKRFSAVLNGDGSYSVELSLNGYANKVRTAESFACEIDAGIYRTVYRGTDSLAFAANSTALNDCKDFSSALIFGVYKKCGTGITFISKTPAKFKHKHSFTNQNGAYKYSFVTELPVSYGGENASSQTLLAYVDMTLNEALKKYAAALAPEPPRDFEKDMGWSTWDYYFTSAAEADIEENMREIKADPVLSQKLKYIAIDDGWQQREGDWYAGGRFIKGMKHTADLIKSYGFKPGIWTAPTRMHVLCGTVMRNHSFIVRDSYGDPITDEDMYVVDPTHPDGEKYLRRVFAPLKEAGYSFFKIDFIANMLQCDYFYDKNAGHYDALRRLFTIVREEVGKGSHIMGCGYPFAAGFEYVDSRRTGLDIHNQWKHVVKCTDIFTPQFAFHDKLYFNDIDYLVVRGSQTSDEAETNVINPSYHKTKDKPGFVWRGGDAFDYTEAKTWCCLTLAAGSAVFLGDRLKALNDSGKELIRKTVLNADFEAAEPMDMTDGENASVWRAHKSGRLYLINWTDTEKTFEIQAGDGYTDIFTENTYAAKNGKLKIILPPHGALALKPN